jgi:stage II sporulation protein GA (sporulation sigma-E factor processing peptidase)
MTVYIEYVLIDNFVIDYLLLKATFALTGMPVREGRLFFCAFLGAVQALLFPLLIFSPVITVAIKLLMGLLLVLLSTNYKTFKSFYVNACVFFFYTFLTGGAIMGVFSILGLDYSSEISIALMFLPVYILSRFCLGVIKHLYRKKDVKALIVDIEMTAGGVTVKNKGFFDTGNGLYDGFNPVIVCEKRLAEQFIVKSLGRIKLKDLTVTTVTGDSVKKAFILEQLKIYNGDKWNIYYNVSVVITPKVGDGFGVILHPSLMEVIDDKKSIFEIEKVC